MDAAIVHEEMSTPRALRALVIAQLAAWIALAPAYRQIFGGRAGWAPAWDLYAELGLELVRARFYVVRGDAREELDRYAALGFHDPRLAPRWLRTLRGETGALRVARELCKRVGDGAVIQVDAQIATRRGWSPIFADAVDLCRPQPPRALPPERRRGR